VILMGPNARHVDLSILDDLSVRTRSLSPST